MTIDVPERGSVDDLLLMTLIKPATLVYKAGSISIEAMVDQHGGEMFTITHGNRLLGYFEPMPDM